LSAETDSAAAKLGSDQLHTFARYSVGPEHKRCSSAGAPRWLPALLGCWPLLPHQLVWLLLKASSVALTPDEAKYLLSQLVYNNTPESLVS